MAQFFLYIGKTIIENYLPPFKLSIMKKFLSIFSIAAVMVACNSNPKTTSADEARKVADSLRFAADTAGLAQYQAWKSQNELVNATPYDQQNLAQNAAPVSSTRRTSSTTRRASSSNSG